MSPSGRHAAFASQFGLAAQAVRDWDAPAPVEGWTARDVVGHLVEWLPAFLESSSDVVLGAGPSVSDDPLGAWTAHAAAVQELLDDPASESKQISNPHMGQMPLLSAVDMIYTTDVFLHTWDLARAAQSDLHLDETQCAELLAGMEPIDDMLRTSGQYGPKMPVRDDGTAEERLMGFIGRDPYWTP